MSFESGKLFVDKVIAEKVQRLVRNEQPRVLDLFAGCGGLSLGFHKVGFDISAAVEIDELAALSHAQNFYKGQNELIEAHKKARDITQLEPAELVKELRLGPCDRAFDVIIGGPPCQAYARVGRAKLREVMDHPKAFKVDPRGNLYLRYMHYVKKLKPLALLMENVPDILNYGGHNVVEEMVEALDEIGYVARYSLINSAHHGVPQMRDRVFMVAVRKEIGAGLHFPKATNFHNLPSGYAGTRAVAYKLIDMLNGTGFVEADLGNEKLPPAITAKEALSDLPPITLHQEGKLKRGARRFTELLRYRKGARLSKYVKQMRQWEGFEAGEGVFDHVLRCLPRDTEIFRNMAQGDEYPAANRVAFKLFEQEAKRQGIFRDSDDWNVLHRKMVPPYPITSFPNRWWKLREDGPSRTLMAHIGKDTYSHIHYDSDQARVITPREAARLQSFPDGFTFAGTMNPAFRQIGNAVPPLMSFAMAKCIQQSLAEACVSTQAAAE